VADGRVPHPCAFFLAQGWEATNLPATACSLFSVFLTLPQNHSATHGLYAVAVSDKIFVADNYPRGSHNHFTASFTIGVEATFLGFDAGRLDSCKRQKAQ
jgi:hypothetical protein